MRRTLSHLPPLVCAVLCGALVTPFPSSAAPPETPTPKVAQPVQHRIHNTA